MLQTGKPSPERRKASSKVRRQVRDAPGRRVARALLLQHPPNRVGLKSFPLPRGATWGRANDPSMTRARWLTFPEHLLPSGPRRPASYQAPAAPSRLSCYLHLGMRARKIGKGRKGARCPAAAGATWDSKPGSWTSEVSCQTAWSCVLCHWRCGPRDHQTSSSHQNGRAENARCCRPSQ